jgi:acyl-[acyl-carrier-protein]-phospholipid O-acyltransferase/long-chain-fatty-acid--[acyl-carrier-protein] ligase
VTPTNAPQGPAIVFASALGIRAAIDLCGLAIAGGLFIVPAFAAVQIWSGADHRARTIAAVNILNAAFMTGATIAVAIMQKCGATVPTLFLLVGGATLCVALAIWRTMPKA